MAHQQVRSLAPRKETDAGVETKYVPPRKISEEPRAESDAKQTGRICLFAVALPSHLKCFYFLLVSQRATYAGNNTEAS